MWVFYYILDPYPVLSPNAEAIDAVSVTLTWEAPGIGGVDSYVLTRDGQIDTHIPPETSTYSLTYMFGGLFPGDNYTYGIISVSNSKRGGTVLTSAVQCKYATFVFIFINVSLQ